MLHPTFAVGLACLAFAVFCFDFRGFFGGGLCGFVCLFGIFLFLYGFFCLFDCWGFF